MKRLLSIVAAGLVLFACVNAQTKSVTPVVPPSLTETQRLQIETIRQRLEIAQLRAQAAQKDFDGARAELGRLMGTLKVEGYTLDLATLSYQKEVKK